MWCDSKKIKKKIYELIINNIYGKKYLDIFLFFYYLTIFLYYFYYFIIFYILLGPKHRGARTVLELLRLLLLIFIFV